MGKTRLALAVAQDRPSVYLDLASKRDRAKLQDALWQRGGFPDSLQSPNEARSLRWRENFIRTYLERDIAQFGPRITAETPRRLAMIIETFQQRPERIERCACRVEMAQTEKNEFNLNISRYTRAAVGKAEILLEARHQALVEIEKAIAAAKLRHNDFLKDLGWSPLPWCGSAKGRQKNRPEHEGNFEIRSIGHRRRSSVP